MRRSLPTLLVAATLSAAALVPLVLRSARGRNDSAEARLGAEVRFLEAFVSSVAAVSGSHEEDDILERTCTEARELFRAHAARVLSPDEEPVRDASEVEGGLRLPLRAGETAIGTLELRRPEPFTADERARAAMLADVAARALDNARLVAAAREREDERARLTERLITAEQDERRRLSIFLHDGPLQSMSGIALMHDAALAAIREGRHEEAAMVIESSLERERETIRTLRDLSFAIEPLVLRDQGFAAAVEALADQVERSHAIAVEADVGPGEGLGEKAQVALYQLVREGINQALRRRPSRIAVAVAADGDGFTASIHDDGVGERRRGGIEELDERVRVLSGRVSVETHDERGTTVRVELPPYVAAPAEPTGH